MLSQIQGLGHTQLTLRAHSIGDRPEIWLQNSSPTSPALLVTFSTRLQLIYRICCAVLQALYQQAFQDLTGKVR
ncbi:hypothetical protein ACWATR_36460 [Nostoc sp. UIC 10890]